MKRLFCLVLLPWLAACALAPPTSPLRPQAAAITAFSFNGRLSVRQGEQQHHAHIDWRHEAGNDEILLSTPFGQGLAKINRDADGARLLLADGHRYSGADWRQLAARVLGFAPPPGPPQRWLLGQSLTPQGSNGWRVETVRRESAAANALPTLIVLRRDDVEARLLIDSWMLPPQ